MILRSRLHVDRFGGRIRRSVLYWIRTKEFLNLIGNTSQQNHSKMVIPKIFTGTEDVQFVQAPYAGHPQERFARRRGFHGLTLITWIIFIALMTRSEILRI